MKKINKKIRAAMLTVPALTCLPIITFVSCSKKTPTELKIIKQPQSKNVAYPNGVEFEVEVNNPSLVKSYKWQLERTDEVWVNLEGIYSNDSKLVLPSTRFDADEHVRCIITDVNDNIIISESARAYIINKSEFIPYVQVAEYAITPGKTLDLSNTIYGSGKISMSEEGDVITFNNVFFDNSHRELTHHWFTPSIDLVTINNAIEKYTFKFIGTNTINNHYWKESFNSGGAVITILSPGKGIEPLIEFTGDGKLTLVGGAYGIFAAGDLIVDIDLNLFSDHLHRLTKGINCQGIEIKSNHTINAAIGGTLIFVETSEKRPTKTCEVIINDGVNINCDINPGYVVDGRTPTQIFGISSVDDMVINKANINISFSVNVAYSIEHKKQLNPIYGLMVQREDSTLKINNSNINVVFTAYNVQEYDLRSIIERSCGICAPTIAIDNSIIDINIQSTNITNVRGIEALNCDISNSLVDIKAKSNVECQGIYVNSLFNGVPGHLSITSSDVNLFCDFNLKSYSESNYINAAIVANTINLDLKPTNQIKMKCGKKCATMVCEYEYSKTKQEHVTPPYSPSHITGLQTSSGQIAILENGIGWNCGNYIGETDPNIIYVNYESLYAINESTVGELAETVTLYCKPI